jgi:hypothetical protein
VSIADRLRELLGTRADPAEDEPAADPDDERDEDDEDDDASLYPLW